MPVNLRDFIQTVYEKAPALREKLEQAGVRPEEISETADLARIPVTHKTDLIDLQRSRPPFGGFLTLPVQRLQRIFLSPGPLYDPQGTTGDYWRWSEALQAAGFGPGDLVLNTFSYHLTPAGFMFDEALRRLGAVVIPAGVGNTELQVRLMADLEVTGYVGTPSFLATLLDKGQELGFDPQSWSLRKAFVTAEKLPDSLRQRLEGQGIAVYQGYGTADVGCIGYECEARDGLHLAEGVIVEIVDPETGRSVPAGETGEIVVTLLEETYPLLRFGTGDLSSLITETCRCGRSTPRLAGLYGRVGEAVKVKGMFVYQRQIEEVLRRFPEVGRYQVVVFREGHRDRLVLRVEPGVTPGEGQWAAATSRLLETFREVIRLRPELEILLPGTLPSGVKILEDRRQWT